MVIYRASISRPRGAARPPEGPRGRPRWPPRGREAARVAQGPPQMAAAVPRGRPRGRGAAPDGRRGAPPRLGWAFGLLRGALGRSSGPGGGGRSASGDPCWPHGEVIRVIGVTRGARVTPTVGSSMAPGVPRTGFWAPWGGRRAVLGATWGPLGGLVWLARFCEQSSVCVGRLLRLSHHGSPWGSMYSGACPVLWGLALYTGALRSTTLSPHDLAKKRYNTSALATMPKKIAAARPKQHTQEEEEKSKKQRGEAACGSRL